VTAVGTRAERPEALLREAARRELAGDWEAADGLYRDAFQLAARDRRCETLVEVVRKQAVVRGRRGLTEEAEDLANLAYEIADRCGDGPAAARLLNVLGFLRYSVEDLPGARDFYERALTRARREAADEVIGIVCMNLGILANIRGDFAEARMLYLESIGATVRSDDRRIATMAYNNLGKVCTNLGEWLEADLSFARGIEIAETMGDRPLLARLHGNQAEPLIETGDYGGAHRALEAAEALVGPEAEAVVLSPLARMRSRLARKEGRLEDAKRDAQQALEIARSRGLPLEEAQAREERARLRREMGRAGDARADLEEALAGYRSVEAVRDAERVEALLRELPDTGD